VHRWPAPHHLSVAAIVAASALFAAAPALAGVDRVSVEGPLVRYAPVVPPDARARVDAVYDTRGDSTITLRVSGLRPNTEYGAHAHVAACEGAGDSVTGARVDPRAAGPDFQLVPNPDPEAPHDRTYENPVNEIWLDLETDQSGNGVATTTVPWQFSPARRAASVIIHAERTHTGPDGPPGTAGPRLACLTVGF